MSEDRIIVEVIAGNWNDKSGCEQWRQPSTDIDGNLEYRLEGDFRHTRCPSRLRFVVEVFKEPLQPLFQIESHQIMGFVTALDCIQPHYSLRGREFPSLRVQVEDGCFGLYRFGLLGLRNREINLGRYRAFDCA
jgi:hypothetical protein